MTLQLPAAGASVSYVSCAAERQPDVVIGKPSKDLALVITEKFKLNPSKTLMVGDRLNTDIEFGKNGGFQTLLVLSGCHGLQDVEKAPRHLRPDFIANQLGDLLNCLN